jgi:hypothetical protein
VVCSQLAAAIAGSRTVRRYSCTGIDRGLPVRSMHVLIIWSPTRFGCHSKRLGVHRTYGLYLAYIRGMVNHQGLLRGWKRGKLLKLGLRLSLSINCYWLVAVYEPKPCQTVPNTSHFFCPLPIRYSTTLWLSESPLVTLYSVLHTP